MVAVKTVFTWTIYCPNLVEERDLQRACWKAVVRWASDVVCADSVSDSKFMSMSRLRTLRKVGASGCAFRLRMLTMTDWRRLRWAWWLTLRDIIEIEINRGNELQTLESLLTPAFTAPAVKRLWLLSSSYSACSVLWNLIRNTMS